MTGCTVIAHGVFVRSVLSVASCAVRWRFPVLFPGGMTVHTFGLEMSPDSLEVCKRVVETVFDKNHYLGVPAFVFGVTGRALVAAGLRVKTVKAGGRVNIGRNVLMTIHAKPPLSGFVEHCVAGGAFGLKLSMASDNVTGHQQGFDVLRRRVRICENSNRHRYTD